MSSTMRQRFYREEKELRVHKPFAGKVRFLTVCLDYEGSESPLGCIVDGERLVKVAKANGVKDITKMYDNGSTPKFPSPAELRETIEAIAARCKKHDYFVFHYSGHGANQENPDAQCGMDTVLCLRERGGEDAEMVDNDLAALIAEKFDPTVRILVLCDACHSASVLDCDMPGIWGGGRKVCALSGCQIGQCSNDTGNGGAMTNTLLKVLNSKAVKRLRKDRKCSIQYVFNRMVEAMPEDEEDEEEEEFEDDEEECASDEEEEECEDSEDEEGGEEDPITGEEPEPGQNINLSWPGGCDPTMIAWPF